MAEQKRRFIEEGWQSYAQAALHPFAVSGQIELSAQQLRIMLRSAFFGGGLCVSTIEHLKLDGDPKDPTVEQIVEREQHVMEEFGTYVDELKRRRHDVFTAEGSPVH